MGQACSKNEGLTESPALARTKSRPQGIQMTQRARLEHGGNEHDLLLRSVAEGRKRGQECNISLHQELKQEAQRRREQVQSYREDIQAYQEEVEAYAGLSQAILLEPQPYHDDVNILYHSLEQAPPPSYERATSYDQAAIGSAHLEEEDSCLSQAYSAYCNLHDDIEAHVVHSTAQRGRARTEVYLCLMPKLTQLAQEAYYLAREQHPSLDTRQHNARLRRCIDRILEGYARLSSNLYISCHSVTLDPVQRSMIDRHIATTDMCLIEICKLALGDTVHLQDARQYRCVVQELRTGIEEADMSDQHPSKTPKWLEEETILARRRWLDSFVPDNADFARQAADQV